MRRKIAEACHRGDPPRLHLHGAASARRRLLCCLRSCVRSVDYSILLEMQKSQSSGMCFRSVAGAARLLPLRLAGRLSLAALVLLTALSAQGRHHHPKANHAGESGEFDYYVLSLSWAPTYCLTHADDGD